MNLNQKIQSYLNEHKNTKKRLSATALLSLLIALAVVSSLIMPAISMTMASISSDAGENSSISLITQATAGTPSTITDSTAGQTMLDLTSADTWTASLMCNNDYFYEATNAGVTTNKQYSTSFDEITISAYIEYEFDQNVSGYLIGDGPHLGWDLGNPAFTAKFIDEETGQELKNGTVTDPNYTAGIAGTYVIENGFVKVTLTDDYIAFVNSGNGSIRGSLDFSGTLSQSKSGNGNQSFTLNGQTVVVDFPDQYPSMNKGVSVNTDGTITWNVYINNSYNVDLSDYSFLDTMLSNATEITVNPAEAATITGNSISFTDRSDESQWITITYKTNITEAELKNGSSTNEAHLKPNDGTDKDIPASNTATFNNPFTVDKTGKQDYQSGAYGNMINWTINVNSNYGTSLNGYIIEDTNIPDGTVLTANDGSTIESLGNGKWKLHTTNPSVTITYSAPATAGQTNSNTATLLYPDNTTTNATDKEDIPYDEVKNLITVEKSGYAVNSDGTISWTIKVKNPYGLSLDGDTVTDKMLSSAVGTVNISPAGSGTHSGSTVTLSGKATEITLTYTTKITDAQLNANNADNDVTLKHGNDEITDDADVPLPDPFDVTKNGTPDYQNGTYDHKINWTVTIKSNYSTSLDGYYISDSQLPKGATATPSSGSLTWDDTAGMWKLSGTSGNTVTIKYQSAAVDGNNANSVDLYYSENVDDDTDSDKADGTETTVEYKDESGIISLNKGYTINTTDGTIEWTIAVSNQYGLNLEGYTITDLMLIKAIDDAVTFSPAGSGTYDAESGLVTLTSATEGQRYITIKYSTAITETELKDGKASNKATLKSDSDDNNDGNDDTVGETTKDATFTSPYFNVTKTGNQDYVNGNYGSKITWTIKLESKYGSSFDGYILTDTFKENGSPKDVDLSSATVSPSGSLTKNDAGNWVISGTNGANTVYITYTTDAVGGTTYSNEVGLGYSDGTDTGVNKGSSGDVEYKSNDDLVTLGKSGYYDKDAHTVKWTINVTLLGGNNDCVLTDTKFPATLAELTFNPDIRSCAALNGDTLTITDSTSSSFTITYYEDVTNAVIAGTTVIENEVNGTTATVPVSNRNELTKRLNSNGYETINSNGVVTRTLNWIANITRDGAFAGQEYTDTLEIGVTDAGGTAITGDGSTHTITNEQLAAIVVKARTTQYGNETTLALGTDYTVTRSDNGFKITFNATLDEAKYNYVTITYNTTATAGAVTVADDKYPVKYVFGNGADFDDKSADGGDFTLVKNNPVLKTTLDFTAAKSWQNDTYADRPDSIYIKVWYKTNKDSTWRTLRGSGTSYIYYGDAGYDSASDYIIAMPKDTNGNSQSSTLTGLYKEVALPEADGTRGSSTYYYYKIEEVNKVTSADGNVTYESIANNAFDTSTGTYEVTYSNNDGINYTGTATVNNKFYRTTAVTPAKQWSGDEGSGNGILSVTVRLEYAVDGTYYPVEVNAGKYVFDFGAETAGTTVLTQNVNITADWKGTTWDNLPTAMIVDGTLKSVSYRIVETAYTTASGTTDITGSRFVVSDGYYDISTYGGSDGNGGQLLTVKNDFKATEKLTVGANKVWSGDESEEYSDNRPDAILVKLQQRSSANYQWTDYETETVDNGDSTSTTTVITRQLNEGNNWSYEWEVPNQSVAEDGTSVDYSYRVVEVGYVNGENTVYFTENQTSFAVTSEGKYTISYNNGSWGSNELAQGTGGTITVTNTFTPVGTIDITPQKKWVGDADFAATDRPTSITFTLQRKVGNGEWETVMDENHNVVTVTLTSNENDTTETSWDGVVSTYWNADTLTDLPERVVVPGDNGTYTEQICQYQLVETSYVIGGTSYDIAAGSTMFRTTNGVYKITTNSTVSGGVLTNINTFDESIGILKSALDESGNKIDSITVDELEKYKYGDYYIFNWLLEYDCPDTNDSKQLAKITPIADKLPTGFTLCEDSSYNTSEKGITTYNDTSASITSPIEYPKYSLANANGNYYLSPCIVWPKILVDTIKAESTIKAAWENPGQSPSRYYYDKSQNTVYFGKPSISAVPSFVYSIKIECSVLQEKLVNGSFSFSNNAERYDVESTGAGTPTGKTASATLKITNPIDTKLINKTYQGKTNTPGEIKFSLNINPEGKNLSTGSTIDIQDVFDTVSYFDADIGSGKLYDATTNPDNYQKLVDVLMNNIKLYEVDANGNKLELSSSDYTLLFATGDDTGNGALMQLTVPDEKHIIIEYTYKLIANEYTPSVLNGCKSSTRVNGRYATMAPGFVPPAKDQINFTNTATLKADSATDDSTVKETNYTVFKSSGTISTNALPKIKKVKTSDYSIDTLGASFMLAKYENGKWYYYTAIDEEGAITWGAEGMDGTKVSSEAQAITVNGSEDFPVALDEDVLYKVIEIAYPTEGGEFEGSNLFPDLSDPNQAKAQFGTLILNYLNDGSTFIGDKDYSVFLRNYISTHYFAYNSTITSYPSEVDPESVIQVKVGGNVEIPNNELIDIAVNKNWINPQSAIEDSEITVELYWSYEKSASTPTEWTLATAEDLGIMDENFSAEKTLTITLDEDGNLITSDTLWTDLPNGKNDKPIYYYIKETSYTIGGIKYTLNEETGEYISSTGTGAYLPTYAGNAANASGTIDVRNSYQLMLKKEWKNSSNDPLRNIPVDKVIVSIYGIDNDGAVTSDPLFTDVEISAANDWTTDITALLGTTDLSMYKSFVAEESAGSSLDGYVVSCVFNLNADTGEIIVTNKNTTPTEASVTVDKVWSDGDAMHANDSITVTLYQLDYELTNLDDLEMKLPDDCKMTKIDEDDTQQYVDVVLNADNDWQYIWTGLPLEDDEQNRYYYYVLETVTEKAEDGSGVANADKYTASYVITSQTTSNTVFQVANTRRSISIQKQWLDENGNDVSDEISIESIELEVLKKVATVPEEGVAIVSLGDSITAGYNDSTDGISETAYPTTLTSLLKNGGYTLVDNTVHNAGVSGKQVASFTSNVNYDKITSATDIICLLGGTNDMHQSGSAVQGDPEAIYERLKSLITTLRQTAPDSIIFVGTIPYFDFISDDGSITQGGGWWYNANDRYNYDTLQDYADYCNGLIDQLNYGNPNDPAQKSIQTLAKDFGNLYIVDTCAELPLVDSKGNVLSDSADMFQPDGCHPDNAGYAAIANAFYNAIVKLYTQSPQVGDIVLSAENNWMASYDIASNDTSTEYYVNESSVPAGWVVSYENQNQTMGSGVPITVKNTRNVPKTSLSIEKTWENDSGDPSARDSISLTLFQSIDKVDWEPYDVEMPAPTKSEDGTIWTYSYTGLPAEDNDGNQLYYKVEEDPMSGYTTKYNVNILEAVDGDNAGTMKITNTRAISLKLKKDWSDYDPETKTHLGDTVILKIYRALLANGRTDDLTNVDLVLQVTPKNLGLTVGGEAATITANKPLTADSITPSEGYEEYITYELSPDGKTITVTAIKETDTPVTLTVTDGTDTETITITASAYTLYYDGEKASSVPSMRVDETGHKLSVKKGSSTYTDVTYVSNDESILTVDPTTGEITGVNIGTASVSVYTNDNLTTPIFTQDIAVGLPETFEIVQKTGTAQEVTIGSSIQLGVDKDYGTFNWESKDPSKATVSVEEDGTVKVTGVAAGSVTITATRAAYGDDPALTKEYTINVANGDIFENSNVVVRVPVGETVKLTSASEINQIYWHDGSIVSTDLSNNVITITGVKAGEITITVKGKGWSTEASFKVIVYDKFSVSPATKALEYGGTVTLTPNTTDAVTYTIKSGANLIDISGNTVTAKSGTEGTAVIEAKNTVTGETATVTIEVVAEIPEVQTSFSGASTISIDKSKAISCIRVNLQHSGSNWEYITVKLDGSDSNKAKFGYNGTLPLIMESKTETNVSFAITDSQNGDVEITFKDTYQPSSISIENNGNVTPTGTVTVVYASTNAASVSSLSLYGASMSNMLFGADADEPAAEVLNYQLYTTVELEYNASAPEGEKWTYVLDNLDVFDQSGTGTYIYWVVEDPTFSDYSVSYLFDDGDENSDYFINADAANSDGEFVATVRNTKQESSGVMMPSTGGEGTAKFYYTGGAMVLLALIAGSNRIRRRVKERRTK